MIIRFALIAVLISGCCTTPPHGPIDLPPRPVLEPIDPELQATIPAHVKAIIGRNYALWQEYVRKLESRVTIHNEALDD